ncbi:protein-glutamate O-methyltransferase CheR [Gemmatimonas sp.]|uniref:CheR family methyltransferase n=1 Tax=Gemmatimonas sp. TaxID=1962908 RepID=UPI0035626249
MSAQTINESDGQSGESAFDIELTLLLEAIFQRYHCDFRGYAKSSLRRRLRQAMDRFGDTSLSALQGRLLHDARALPILLDYLTVQVSEMFRDPTHFLALRRDVLPLLATYPSLKIWIAGCSTGEELFSLAITLAEAGLLDRTIIYATDVNEEALRKAEAGVYALDRVAGFSANYAKAGGTGSLSDWFTAAYDGVVFDRRLRRNVVFSDHSLSTDSDFAATHLVMCRNVLIYFHRELQDRAIGLFEQSLVPRGFLALGSKENLRISSRAAAFETFDGRERIYRKRP